MVKRLTPDELQERFKEARRITGQGKENVNTASGQRARAERKAGRKLPRSPKDVNTKETSTANALPLISIASGQGVDYEDIQTRLNIAFNPDRNMEQNSFFRNIGRFVAPIPYFTNDLLTGRLANNFRSQRNEELQDKQDLVAEREELKNAIAQLKDESKRERDLLSTNFLEQITGTQSQFEKELRAQLEQTQALSLQNANLKDQLTNTQNFIQNQQALQQLQNQAQAEGIKLPSISSSQSNGFLQKYGVPIGLGVVALIALTR